MPPFGGLKAATDSLTFLPLGYGVYVLSPQIWASLSDLLPLVEEMALQLLPGSLGALSFQGI